MMLFGFGRVPGCLGLGALFLWDEWREGRTDRQTVYQRGVASALRWMLEGVWYWRCAGCMKGCEL